MITYTGAQMIANWFCGKTYARNGLYVGLSKTEPTLAGGNVSEPSASTYHRVMIASAASSPQPADNFFGNPSSGEDGKVTIRNNKTVYFPETWNVTTEECEDWDECNYACLFSAQTGGSLLAFVELTHPIHPGEDGVSGIPIIRVGDLALSFGNPEE